LWTCARITSDWSHCDLCTLARKSGFLQHVTQRVIVTQRVLLKKRQTTGAVRRTTRRKASGEQPLPLPVLAHIFNSNQLAAIAHHIRHVFNSDADSASLLGLCLSLYPGPAPKASTGRRVAPVLVDIQQRPPPDRLPDQGQALASRRTHTRTFSRFSRSLRCLRWRSKEPTAARDARGVNARPCHGGR